MDNNKLQQMQNWKKQIIMDSVLNYLFDSTLSPEDFLHSHILTLEQEQIVNIYSKLASLKHSLSKNIQKEVQTKHPFIQASFYSLQQLQNNFPKTDRANLQNTQKTLQRFNKKYQIVNKSVLQWKNITKILHYAENLQNFQGEIRLLKALLKNFNNNDAKQTLNTLKVSKIIKNLTEISQKYDFSGISLYQNERVFIKSSRELLYGQNEKQINNLLLSSRGLKGEIREKILIFRNINKLTEFITSFYKRNLKQIGQILKKTFSETIATQFIEIVNSPTSLSSKITLFGKNLIYVEEMIKQMKINDILVNNGIPNLFLKMWGKMVDYMREILKWVSDQELKDKERPNEDLLIWKYPIIFEMMSYVANQIHFYLVSNTSYTYYNFLPHKQDFMLILTGLAKNFYKTLQATLEKHASFVHKIKDSSAKMQEFLKNNKFLQFLEWLVRKIKNPKILKTVLKCASKHIKNIRQVSEGLNLYLDYNNFVFEAKTIFTSNPNLQIHSQEQIKEFKLMTEPDYNINQTEQKQWKQQKQQREQKQQNKNSQVN